MPSEQQPLQGHVIQLTEHMGSIRLLIDGHPMTHLVGYQLVRNPGASQSAIQLTLLVKDVIASPLTIVGKGGSA